MISSEIFDLLKGFFFDQREEALQDLSQAEQLAKATKMHAISDAGWWMPSHYWAKDAADFSSALPLDLGVPAGHRGHRAHGVLKLARNETIQAVRHAKEIGVADIAKHFEATQRTPYITMLAMLSIAGDVRRIADSLELEVTAEEGGMKNIDALVEQRTVDKLLAMMLKKSQEKAT